MITQQLIADTFEYKDGYLYWKKPFNPNKANLIGKVAGSIHKTGYQHITWMNKSHKAHRLIFMLHHGYLPDYLDHINNNRADNRIENLRPATHSENNFNASMAKNNTSGFRGVNWHKHSKSWVVRVCAKGKSKSIGYFDDLELAGLVADEARNLYHGKFAYQARLDAANL